MVSPMEKFDQNRRSISPTCNKTVCRKAKAPSLSVSPANQWADSRRHGPISAAAGVTIAIVTALALSLTPSPSSTADHIEDQRHRNPESTVTGALLASNHKPANPNSHNSSQLKPRGQEKTKGQKKEKEAGLPISYIKPYFSGPAAGAFSAGRFDVAAPLFQAHMDKEKDPEKKWAAGLLAAVAWFNSGKPAKAAELLKPISHTVPPTLKPYVHGIRARALLRSDNPKEALDELNKLEKLGAPPCAAGGDILHAKALALVKLGRHKETVQLLSPMFTLKSQSGQYPENQGATVADAANPDKLPYYRTKAGAELISLMVTALEGTGDTHNADGLRRVIYFRHPASWNTIYRGTPYSTTQPANPTPRELLERANAYYQAHQHQRVLDTLAQIAPDLPIALNESVESQREKSTGKTGSREQQRQDHSPVATVPSGSNASPALTSKPGPIQTADTIESVIARAQAETETKAQAPTQARQSTPATATMEELCEAVFMAGHTYTKMRRHSLAWPILASLAHLPECNATVSPDRILYHGARSAGRSNNRDEAIALFSELSTKYPDSSLADDALLILAELHMEEAKEQEDLKNEENKKAAVERARKALQTLVDRHPNGDMREEAQFRLAWEPYMRGDMDEALNVLNATSKLNLPERHYYAKGRTAYWKGRILQKKGDTKLAAASWQKVVKEHPLSYYALLATNRLVEAGFSIPGAELPLATPAQSTTPHTDDIHVPAIHNDIHLERAILFMKLGMGNAAAQELNNSSKSLAALAGDTSDLAVTTATTTASAQQVPTQEKALWMLAALYDQAGIYNQSHDIPRRQLPHFANQAPSTTQSLHRWLLAYPRAFKQLIDAAASSETISPMLLTALVREESAFTPSIESWANAIGLSQLLVPTARDVAKRGEGPINASTLRDPELNLRLGARFLGGLINRFDHFGLAIAGYNAGGGAVSRWLSARGHLAFDEFVETIPYEQTRNYTKRVTESYGRYSHLYHSTAGTASSATYQPFLQIPNTIKK